MKFLLDTHIWIWSQLDVEKLSKRVREELSAPMNEIWLSPISVWELSLLVEKRRVALDQDAFKWTVHALTAASIREAPLTIEVMLATRGLSVHLGDPADLFLAATAKIFDLTLVTADARLLEEKSIATLANR